MTSDSNSQTLEPVCKILDPISNLERRSAGKHKRKIITKKYEIKSPCNLMRIYYNTLASSFRDFLCPVDEKFFNVKTALACASGVEIFLSLSFSLGLLIRFSVSLFLFRFSTARITPSSSVREAWYAHLTSTRKWIVHVIQEYSERQNNSYIHIHIPI